MIASPSSSVAESISQDRVLSSVGVCGDIETEVITGGEFWMVTEACAEVPSPYPSFGVTRIVQTLPTEVAEE